MVAAGRSLVERGALLHQLPRANLVAVAGLEIELTANGLFNLTADGLDDLASVHGLDRQLLRNLASHTDGLFQADNVEHDVVIVNFLVRLVLRSELALFASNANNLIQHFLSLFPLVLLFLCCQHSCFFVLFGQVQDLPAFVTIIKP